eukprot:Selendium_serpulae@DN1619_c0_g1_i1.p1
MSSPTNVGPMVDENIKKAKVTVFAKSYCPYCKRAIQAIKDNNITDANIVQIDGHKQMDEIQNHLQTLTGGRTVPRVFICGKFYGGCDETLRGFQNGSFMAQLNQC